MIALRAIQPGEEIINSYGELSSSELLRRFGFTEASPNPHGCVDLPVQALLDVAASRSGPPTRADQQSRPNKRPSAAPMGPDKPEPNCAPAAKKHYNPSSLADEGIEPCCTSSAAQRSGHIGQCDHGGCKWSASSEDKGEEHMEERVRFLLRYGLLGAPSRPSGGSERTKRSGRRRSRNAQLAGNAPTHARAAAQVPGYDGGPDPGSLGGDGVDSRARHGGRIPLGPAKFAAFRIPSSGASPADLVEAARLLTLPWAAFARFRREVLTWRVPLAKPLTALPATGVNPPGRASEAGLASSVGVPGVPEQIRSGCLTDEREPPAHDVAAAKAGRRAPDDALETGTGCGSDGSAAARSQDEGADVSSCRSVPRGSPSCGPAVRDAGCGAAGCRSLLLAVTEHMLGRYPGDPAGTLRDCDAAPLEDEAATLAGGKLGCAVASLRHNRAQPESLESREPDSQSLQPSRGEQMPFVQGSKVRGLPGHVSEEHAGVGRVCPGRASIRNKRKNGGDREGLSGELNPEPRLSSSKSTPCARSAAVVVSGEIAVWVAFRCWVKAQGDAELLSVCQAFWQRSL
jgi:hypothetical protein